MCASQKAITPLPSSSPVLHTSTIPRYRSNAVREIIRVAPALTNDKHPLTEAPTALAISALVALTVAVVEWGTATDIAGQTSPNGDFWRRSFAAELLLSLLEMWQQAIAVELQAQGTFLSRLGASLGAVAEASANAYVERAVGDAHRNRATISAAAEAAEAGSVSTSQLQPQSPMPPPHGIVDPLISSNQQPLRLLASRCVALGKLQAACGVLQAALWRASTLVHSASNPAPVAGFVSMADVLTAGAAVLRMAPWPLRLVTAGSEAEPSGASLQHAPVYEPRSASVAASPWASTHDSMEPEPLQSQGVGDPTFAPVLKAVAKAISTPSWDFTGVIAAGSAPAAHPRYPGTPPTVGYAEQLPIVGMGRTDSSMVASEVTEI